MAQPRMYISAPIFGYADLNRPTFKAGLQVAERYGYEAVVPLDIEPHSHTGPCPAGRSGGQDAAHTDTCFLRADLRELLTCDGMLLCGEWWASWGCRTEMNVALVSGIQLFHQPIPKVLQPMSAIPAGF